MLNLGMCPFAGLAQRPVTSEYSVAKIGFDTAENEPLKSLELIVFT